MVNIVIDDAFMMHELLQYPYEPKWFLEAERTGRINVLWQVTGKFGASDPLRQSYACYCRIVVHGGYAEAREGDYIVLMQNGEIFPCNSGLYKAADLLESLQRERQEPEPLTFNELSERVGKPVYAGVLERWEIIEFIVPETFSIHMRSGNIFRYGATRLYAAEPKGDVTT